MVTDRIFIHAWWRSGSTYLWSKLREKDTCVCYYEPLHERISGLTLALVEGPENVEISRALRHPLQKKDYFVEYAALIRANNLKFSPALSYDRFLLRPDETDDELRVYIDGLLNAASAAQRAAVLCFCRSQMRSAWMKKVFGGVHIAQVRNPSDQWASFQVEPFFRNKMLIIALKLRNLHPAAFTHIDAFDRFARYMSKHPAVAVEQLFDRFIKEREALAIFLVIWIASALQAVSFTDFVLDIDQVSNNLHWRKTATDWFKTIGCSIDFSDCASPSWGKLPVPPSEFERIMGDAVTAIRTNAASLVIADPDVIRKRLASLSPLSGQVLDMSITG
jgi:hypothetical protein